MPEELRFHFFRFGRTLRRIAIYSIAIAAYACIPAWKEQHVRYKTFADFPPDLHAVLTLVLGCLLVFRTNTAYSKWWEARKLWGSLVNTSRNMAVKVADLVRGGNDELVKFRTEIVAFADSMKYHLRDSETSRVQRLRGFEDCEDSPQHVPAYIVTRMYEELGHWKANGFIDGDELRVLDREARLFLEICGGCERIRNTRIAHSYRAFARQCVFLYLVTFPWGIVNTFHWWTVPITGIVTYFMLGLELVAEDVEEPFGVGDDDLDLDGLCMTIERSVREIFDRRLRQKK